MTVLALDEDGHVVNKIIGVSFDLYEAESHRDSVAGNDFQEFVVSGNWRVEAEQSRLVAAMRDFREIVKAMQDEALR
jgi:hypothetical protein